jgi:hypothetical protein
MDRADWFLAVLMVMLALEAVLAVGVLAHWALV